MGCAGIANLPVPTPLYPLGEFGYIQILLKTMNWLMLLEDKKEK